MKNKKYKNLLTNIEFVGYGHPDRFADFLAERIYNYFFDIDKKTKTAIEIMVTRDKIFLGGEIGKVLSEKEYKHIETIIYNSIDEIYGEKWWPNYREVRIENNIKGQSPELSAIVNKDENVFTTGDQGVSYGFWYYPRMNLISGIYDTLNQIVADFDLSPDYKALLSKGKLAISFCGLKMLYKRHLEQSIKNTLKELDIKVEVEINKLDWNIGGPLADTGMVGRKLMIESFGTGIPHGGGTANGKDFSKADKSGLFIATRIAKEFTDSLKIKKPVLVELDYFINNDYIPYTIKLGNVVVQKGIINFSDEVNKTLFWLPNPTAEIFKKGLIQTFLDYDLY